MAWSLAPRVHGVMVGEDLVLLDVGADAYLCLAGVGAVLSLDVEGRLVARDPAALETLAQAGLARPGLKPDAVEGRLVARDPAALETLAQAGLARPGLKPDAVRPPPRPTRNLPAAAVAGTDARHGLWRTLRAGAATASDFRRLDFAGLLDRAGRRTAQPDRQASAPSPALLSTAAYFARLRVWAPFDGACLKRSYMMLRYLRLCGLDATWVIGVRTWPFRAHCWLQAGEVALDDDVERLLPYHPILAV
ncbi:MAG: lasso peptide biosynthesis B2 protein [Alphaproteobacteria bacterium]|nr:lasso peptide biosynthesis B2 protein [Alphaproteobacteria bacterium]